MTLQLIASGCLGFVAAEIGKIGYHGFTKSLSRPELTTALRYRALLFGVIMGGSSLVMFGSGDAGQFGIICLTTVLLLTPFYAVSWLHLVRTYGQPPVEIAELTLIVAILPFAFLYVCGILWTTLGTVLALGVAGCGGLYFYRVRVRSGAR